MDKRLSNSYLNYFIEFNDQTKKQYDAIAFSYETNYGKLLPLDKNVKILDIGCGMGHFLYYLKTRGYKNFSGIDIGEKQVDFCKKHFTNHVEVANVMNYLKDLEEEYDVIVMNDLIEHIVKDEVINLLELVKKSLKMNGIIIIKTINMNNPFGLNSRYRDFTHEMGYTEQSLSQILDTVGFKQISLFQEIYVFKRIIMPLAKLLRKVFYAFLRCLYYLDRGDSSSILTPNIIAFAKKY